MGDRIRWRVTMAGATVVCLGCNNSAGDFDPRRAVRDTAARAAGPTSLVAGLLDLRHATASGNHAVGDRPFWLCAVEGGFETYLEVAFATDEVLVAGGGTDVVPAKVRRDRAAGGAGDRKPEEAEWYEAFESVHGDYAFVDLRGPWGGATVAGAPGDPGHPMTMAQAIALADEMKDALAGTGASKTA